LVLAVGGFFAGRTSVDRPAPITAPSASASTLPPLERNQLQLNKAKFSGDLAVFAEPWLVRVGECTASGDKDGPRPIEGEKTRVLCRLGVVSVYFIEYKSLPDRDKARTRYVAFNIDARTLTPGSVEPTAKISPSGRAKGQYLEFAFKSAEPDPVVVAGIWWDNVETPVAGYLIAPWNQALGGNWEPLRDAVNRFS
jgi:hypothetical protein